MLGSFGLALSISLDQPSIFLETDRGLSVTHKIKLINRGQEDLNLYVYVRDWVYAENGVKEFLPPGESQYSCADWLELSSDHLTVPANSSREFPFVLKTPGDATGGHQAVIFFEAGLPGSGRINYAARLGALIYQKTKRYSLDYIEPVALKASLQKGRYVYNMDFRNSGDAWNTIQGNVALVSDGEALEQIELYTKGLLPGESVKYSGVFEQTGLPDRMEIFYMLEDEYGNLQTGQVLSADSAKAVAAREMWIEKFDPVYVLAKNAIQINCEIAVTKPRSVRPTVSIYNSETNVRVKTVEFNAKQVNPGNPAKLAVSWPLGLPGSIPPGEYLCVLSIGSGNDAVSARKMIRID
ncbi:hypothetical protein NO2_1461 [Candidatus Termititenax persephonae]|uniref:Uncharacterized protein n=1 Tax=Candidatus Termititenax persephonae TaxID=2218525 RepID=A0A388TJL3_9BACT|nr:hypothetical protein NO2_1461 [Candidatus Termititenax persephonae]